MDKYLEIANILLEKTDPGDRADAKIVIAFALDMIRSIETISSDLDRIATALEAIAAKK